MADINIAELRRHWKTPSNGTMYVVRVDTGLLHTLLDEIERLRAENITFKNGVGVLDKECERLQARIEKLEAALRDAPCTCEGGFKLVHLKTCYYRKAREALEGK